MAQGESVTLINFQFDLKERINKARVNFKKSPKERLTKAYVETRLESVEQLWFEFLNGHKELMRSVKPELLATTDYMQNDLYSKAEDIYLNYKCKLRSMLSQFDVKEVVVPAGSESSVKIGKSSHVKLPKINIPTFSGKYVEWCTFRDLFTSLVHFNSDLEKVQKLHYLKGYLSGEAEQLLRHIPIAENNYDRCWQLLQERYNNKKYLCNQILRRLLSQRNIQNESASALKDLIDTTNDCLSALLNLGIDIKSWDVLIIHLLSLKLDAETRRQWEFTVTESNSADELPTFKQFEEFITNRYRAIEFLDPRFNSGTKPQAHQSNNYGNNNKVKSLHVLNVKCPHCSEEHRLSGCKSFAKETVEDRRNFVQKHNLCFNCLGKDHSVKVCHTKTRCQVCKRKHHSLLHPKASSENTKPVSSNVVIDGSQDDEDDDEGKSTDAVTCFSTGKVYNRVLLATALVKTKSKTGKVYALRALLDQGSQSSFITESVVQSLGLKKNPIKGHISGLGGDNNVIAKAMVSIEITSRTNPGFVMVVKAYVLKTITSPLPSQKVEALDWLDFEEAKLADPEYHTPNRIDMLLGAEVYCKIIQSGIKKGPNDSLVVQATSLGWVISGEVKAQIDSPNRINVMHCRTDDDEILKKFWEIESMEETNTGKILTEEEERCEEFFAKTTLRDNEGRYVVRLPFKTDDPDVKNSREIAEKRLKSLEKRLDKDANLKEKYAEVLKEYITLNHMELVPEKEVNNKKAVYLPHHVVVREDKETTKVRVVFNASSKGTNGKTLNDNMLVGPTLQPDLRHLIMRWRVHPICLTADIVKMYRQVRVSREDIDFQRVLWRPEAGSEIKHYRLLTVTFGTACAPYLAVRSLQQAAVDEGQNYPVAAEKVKHDFYMDDLLTGCQTKEEAIRIYKEINEMLSKAGFEIQKWTTNKEEVLQEMRKEKEKDVKTEQETDKEKDMDNERKEDTGKGLKIKTDNVIKIVGLTWNRSDDSFHYAVDVPELEQPVTKRKIISDISRFYDPLGWAGPSIIISKIMMQKLWLAGIAWDEAVPKQILEEWLTYRKELQVLQEMKIPRWLGIKKGDHCVELHGFCDASKLAYAAVVYVRVVDCNDKVHVALVTAKTRVAPVKQVSIPRLELCGAVLLARLLTEVSRVMNIDKTNIHGWSDSTIVLAWLNSHPSRWKVFVANRVSEILSTLDPQNWSHVSSKNNPADAASRGLPPSELVKSEMWLNGPDFLRNDHIAYNKPTDPVPVTEEEKIKCHLVSLEKPVFDRFSSLTRAMRVIAYCRRFGNKDKRQVSNNYITTQELREAVNIMIRHYQRESFGEDMEFIKKNENLPKRSCLRALNPYFDEDQILRVGGRLEHSQLDSNRKHPIVIPKKSHLTNLIIADAHKQTLHGGPQLMLCYLQAKYWILGAKQLVKSCYRRCVTCIKNSSLTQTQLMGQLPAARTTPTRAFKNCGVDYAGPIQIRTSKGRGQKSHKGYICLFICLVTRAIHLEVVTDLTAEGFLQAFKRLVARRGHCSDMWSDNATNFVGAAGELKKLFVSEQRSLLEEVAESLATNGCNWHFIPARSPNFGGLWEAGVKSVKHHLKRVIGQSTLTFEEMSTVLAQVEACLNSRPQKVINTNDDAVNVLTPGHFLVGEPLVVSPDRNYEASNVGSLRRWQYTQRMLQDFWRLWSKEYLTKFYHRYRWASRNPQPKVGDVVVVREDGLPPARWLYGRVVDTHPGADKLVRVVSIKMKNGIVKRPISKLCLLPIAVEDETE